MTSTALVLSSLLFAISASAQQNHNADPMGVIYGSVVDHDGHPAKGISLEAAPMHVGLGMMLPGTTTDQNGRYRIRSIPWWGRSSVFVEDEHAGYCLGITGERSSTQPSEVTLSPQYPEVKLNLRLPSCAGFLHIRLINSKSGTVIPVMQIKVESQEDPKRVIFSFNSYSDRAIFLPPDKNLLLHISSPGYLEWSKSVATGKLIRISSGKFLDLKVILKPKG